MKQTPKEKTASAQPFNLSLVIPCYNESTRLDILFDAVREFTQKWQHDYEVIIVDDGSKDGTPEKIRSNKIFQDLEAKGKIQLIVLKKNEGKGGALKAGVLAATGDYILTLDADMSTKPLEVQNWLKKESFTENKILIGSRENAGSQIEAKKIRRIVGNIFNFIVQSITPISERDTQCGFKLYPAAAAKKLFGDLKVKGWAHDVEILYKAKLYDYEVKEMPIQWKEAGGSKVSVIKDSVKMFFQILYISIMLNWKWYFVTPFKDTFGKKTTLPTTQEPPIFRFLFAFSILLLLFLMPILSFDFGITGDEFVQREYGDLLVNYYSTFGSDKSALEYKNLYLYGGFFDLIAQSTSQALGVEQPYYVRHFINALFGFLAILFAGLLGKHLGGYRAGFFAIVLLALTPRFFGHSMNNPKDIPFAAAFIFTLFFLFRFIQGLPKPALKDIIFLIVGIAVAINIRIGGLLLFGYFFIFSAVEVFLNPQLRNRLGKDIGRYIKYAALVVIVGFLGGMIFWPYGLQNPLEHPFIALGEMENFSVGIRILFEGAFMMSDEVPWYYIPKWMWITLPIVVLIGAAGFLILPFISKNNVFRRWLLLLFATVFPVAYAIYQDSALYDGLRHFLFVIPALVVGAALFYNSIFLLLKAKAAKITGYVAFAILLFLPLRWMVANHPHEYVYFNEIFGGPSEAYAEYELDYWMNATKPATYWLIENEDLQNVQDSVIVASNASYPVLQYLNEKGAKAKIQYIRWGERSTKDWDYAVLYTRFIDPNQLKNYWPPQEVMHVEKAGGAPLTAVVKRPSKEDLYGYNALQSGNMEEAIRNFESYIKKDTTNEFVYSMLGNAYLQTAQFDKAANAFAHSYKIVPDAGIETNLAVAYLQSGQIQQGMAILQRNMNQLQTRERELYSFLQQNPQDQQKMMELFNITKSLADIHRYLAAAYSQQNDAQTANFHAQEAQRYQQTLQRFQGG